MRYTLWQTDRLANWHKKDFSEVVSLLPNRPTAYVDAEDLEEVYSKTQHGIRSTTDAPEGFRDTSNWVGLLANGIMPAIRSTSVGDVIVDDSTKLVYVVAFAGFDLVGEISEVNKKYGTRF